MLLSEMRRCLLRGFFGQYGLGGAMLQLAEPLPGEPACLSAGGGGLARCGADSPDGGLVPLADFALHAA